MKIVFSPREAINKRINDEFLLADPNIKLAVPDSVRRL